MNVSNKELSEASVNALSTRIMKKNYFSGYSNGDNYLIGEHINQSLGLDMMMSPNKDIPEPIDAISGLTDKEITEENIDSLKEQYGIASKEDTGKKLK